MAEPEANSTTPEPGNPYVAFAIKTAIVVTIVAVGTVLTASFLMDSVDLDPLKASLKKTFREEKTRLRLRGLLTTNPAVHYKMSTILEQGGDIPQAIEEIELGIGLLELHSAEKSVRDRYAQRLTGLKSKLSAAGNKKK